MGERVAWLPGLILALLVAAPPDARGNGDPAATGPPTTFERFVLSACSPCLRESYPVAALAVLPGAPPGFLPATARAAAARHGEIVIEVLRAQQLDRPDWKSLALRLSLAVLTPGGEPYRLGVGLLDGVDVRPLALALAEMVKLGAAMPANPGTESADVDFHGGSLRIGMLRVRGETVAYVQTGDLGMLMQRVVWEVPTTLFLPVKDLPALATALGQAAATVARLRGSP